MKRSQPPAVAARAAKPRAAPPLAAPPAKRPKTSTGTTARPRQQALISDMLAADRRRKAASSAGMPSVISGAAGMDDRRPPVGGAGGASGAASATRAPKAAVAPVSAARPPKAPALSHIASATVPSAPAVVPRRTTRGRGVKVASSGSMALDKAIVRKKPPPSPASADVRAERALSSSASARISVAGGDALRYAQGELPTRATVLLDMLGGLEQAVGLLGTRKAPAEFGAVKKIVESVTRRNFTLRMLAQIAAIVPEAVAVLPPRVVKVAKAKTKAGSLSAAAVTAKRNEKLVVRLDEVSEARGGARARKELLVRRLREHAESCHAMFLRREKVKDFQGLLWHHRFDPDKHVTDLPAPPLYPVPPPEVERSVAGGSGSSQDLSASTQLSAVDSLLMSPSKLRESENSQSSVPSPVKPVKTKKKDGVDSAVPADLLARVRARAAAKAVKASDAPAAATRLILQRLPGTVDAVRSILALGGRSAMGWGALATAVASTRPGTLTAVEVEEQLDVIVKIASGWCQKLALTGSRGGHAFRVRDSSAFGSARAALIAATEIPE